mmetsp:Transcript_44874/g.54914  ORF Transcript_44874/g.54914 Transcript_44874/m.54914 type:complete len:324 (-) Transcript_44874:235-1206(-)
MLAVLLLVLSVVNCSEQESPTVKGMELLNQTPIEDCPPGSQTYYAGFPVVPQGGIPDDDDIVNCGMDSCLATGRFDKPTINDCKEACVQRSNNVPGPNGLGVTNLGCVAFSFANIGGDGNHPNEPVCTMHSLADSVVNGKHGQPAHAQRLCTLLAGNTNVGLNCPAGTVQYGVYAGEGAQSEDVEDCGMLSCLSNDRFGKTIEECRDYCRANGCAVFSWAPKGGDSNHADTSVCTVHWITDITINGEHGPNQIMCKNVLVYPGPEVRESGPSLMAMTQSTGFAAIGLLGFVTFAAGLSYAVMNKYRDASPSNYESVEATTALL